MANANNKGNYTDDRTTKISLSLSVEPTLDGIDYAYSNGILDHSLGHKEVWIRF